MRAGADLGLEVGALGEWLAGLGPVAVVDLETTGFPTDPGAGVLEVGAVLLDPGSDRVRTVSALVRPAAGIPPAIQRLTGITEAAVADAPTIEVLAPGLAPLLADRVLVAHNAPFERHFLSRFVAPGLDGARYLDTQDLLALTHPDAPDLRLESFSRLLLGSEERHRALEDALDTARVVARIAADSRRGQRRYAVARRALESFAPDSPWLSLLGKEAAAPEAEPSPFVRIAIPTAEPRVPFDEDAIAAALADAERGARHFPGYRARPEQVELARSFTRVLRDGGTLLIEGGTGVGKSLAYLAALIPFAMERADRGERGPVVVSTRTRLLQDQLLAKDIPAAARFLGHPELRALSIKGRANYACERRLASTLAEGGEPSIFPEDRLAYAVLAACAGTRPYGELGSVPGAWVRRYPALADLLRRSVAARAEQCTREQCAAQEACPLGARRRALASAHLVVANHDLLLRWPPDYPAFAHAVVDEAHELADVADEVYALEVRPEDLLDRLDEIFGRPGGRAADALLPGGARRRVRADALAWRRGVQQDLTALARALEPLAGEFGEVQVPEHPGPDFDAAAARAGHAAERLDEVAREVEALDGEEGGPLDRATDELRAAARSLRLAFAGSEDSVASFARIEAPWDRWRLALHLVSPADPFREHFLERLESLAGVSASLFVDRDAFAALGELGLEHGPTPRSRVSVPSPFPYAEHMRIAALPDPEDLVGATADALERVARHLNGRTLGLFTSLRRMHDVAAALTPRLRDAGIEVLTPRRASDDPAALVERFRGGSAVLLGARKFWQGLDIPGDSLQAVVIEKLPFEVPTELRRRRELRLRRAGIDPFARQALGRMLLNLKQMVGRLIRTEEDRGLVVIVEGRSRKGYFRRLASALPEGTRVVTVGPDALVGLLDELGLP